MPAIDAALRRAQRSAVEFLLKVGSDKAVRVGNPATFRWQDFQVFGIESDEWVSAYTAYALAETGQNQALESAESTWVWLTEISERHGPGLGYQSLVPQDADATVWGCRLAAALGHSLHKSALRSFDLLQACVRPDGGIATFLARDLQKLKTDGSALSFEGWTTSHACVTAAAAWLPEIVRLAGVFGFLSRAQDSLGFWTGYWWADREYATACAIESLSRFGTGQDLVERALGWLTGRPNPCSPFALALRVLGVAKAGRAFCETSLKELLDLQLADGSWPASARLRIPPPNLKDPRIQWNWDARGNGIGSIVLDQRRIFTTATALRALSSCLVH